MAPNTYHNQGSGYREWRQVYVLAGEIAETAKTTIPERPFPYFAGILAARLFLVMADPLHFMYTKVNNFLNKGPHWTITKLASYWVDRVLLHQPTDDDGQIQEIEWLLVILIDGLRVPNVSPVV